MGAVSVTNAKKKNMGLSWEVEVKATITPASGESTDPMSPTAEFLSSSGNVMHQCILMNQSGNIWVSGTHLTAGEPANAKVRARFLSAEQNDTQPFVEVAFAAAKPQAAKAKAKAKKKKVGAKKPPQ